MYIGLSSGLQTHSSPGKDNLIGTRLDGVPTISDSTPDNPPNDPGPRFLCPALPDSPGSTVTLDADQARHASRVLRLSEGSAVQLIDGKGRIAQATLTGDDPRSTQCVIHAIKTAPAPRPVIELATAIPKGPRGDAMVNDLAQLGVDRLIPLQTQRSVVRPRPTKLQRFAKAAAEAAKQSGRAWFLQVEETAALTDVLACDAGLKLIADPYAQPICDLPDRLDSVSTARIVVGPEGGLTDEELAQARDAGFVPWRYSPNVLRIETAAAAAVAILRSHA